MNSKLSPFVLQRFNCRLYTDYLYFCDEFLKINKYEKGIICIVSGIIIGPI